MRPIDHYLEDPDTLAQEVVETWADYLRIGSAHSLGDDFRVLFDKAFALRKARIIVESHRDLHILTQTEAINEETAQQVFAEVYKIYWEKHEAASSG